MQLTTSLPISLHFTLEPLAEGVYAALATPGGAAFSNAGIIDLGGYTMIFDTFETPRAADDLRLAAERLTGRSVTWVVNSHAHLDHWLGNQVFADHAPIIATEAARKHMISFEAEVKEYKDNPSEVEEWLHEEQERLANETDPIKRTALENSISRVQYSLEALPRLHPRLPDQTFKSKLIFYGSRRTVELVDSGGGHTSGDCFLVLPADGIVFMGDLGFFGREPFMVHCDPHAWTARLEQLEQSEAQKFVPGHGPLGSRAEIALLRQYITTIDAWVTQAVKDGEAVEALLEHPLPPPLDAWGGDRDRLETSLRALYNRLTG